MFKNFRSKETVQKTSSKFGKIGIIAAAVMAVSAPTTQAAEFLDGLAES